MKKLNFLTILYVVVFASKISCQQCTGSKIKNVGYSVDCSNRNRTNLPIISNEVSKNLVALQFHGTGITSLPLNVFDDVKHSLKVLSLGMNRFPCDCSISLLWKDYRSIIKVLPRNLVGFHQTDNTLPTEWNLPRYFPPMTCYDDVKAAWQSFDDIDLNHCKEIYIPKALLPMQPNQGQDSIVMETQTAVERADVKYNTTAMFFSIFLKSVLVEVFILIVILAIFLRRRLKKKKQMQLDKEKLEKKTRLKQMEATTRKFIDRRFADMHNVNKVKVQKISASIMNNEVEDTLGRDLKKETCNADTDKLCKTDSPDIADVEHPIFLAEILKDEHNFEKRKSSNCIVNKTDDIEGAVEGVFTNDINGKEEQQISNCIENHSLEAKPSDTMKMQHSNPVADSSKNLDLVEIMKSVSFATCNEQPSEPVFASDAKDDGLILKEDQFSKTKPPGKMKIQIKHQLLKNRKNNQHISKTTKTISSSDDQGGQDIIVFDKSTKSSDSGKKISTTKKTYYRASSNAKDYSLAFPSLRKQRPLQNETGKMSTESVKCKGYERVKMTSMNTMKQNRADSMQPNSPSVSKKRSINSEVASANTSWMGDGTVNMFFQTRRLSTETRNSNLFDQFVNEEGEAKQEELRDYREKCVRLTRHLVQQSTNTSDGRDQREGPYQDSTLHQRNNFSPSSSNPVQSIGSYPTHATCPTSNEPLSWLNEEHFQGSGSPANENSLIPISNDDEDYCEQNLNWNRRSSLAFISTPSSSATITTSDSRHPIEKFDSEESSLNSSHVIEKEVPVSDYVTHVLQEDDEFLDEPPSATIYNIQ